jgi:hypothetical protein
MFDSLLNLINREAGLLRLQQTISIAVTRCYPFLAVIFG